MLAATLAMFGDVLFLHPDRVISWPGTDTFTLFVYWRDFGFSQMRQGNLPLWNPHLFSGVPFLGNLQSALLYPLNWIFMLLPIAPAINISIATHVFLIGFFMYLWSRSRGIHPAACLMASFLIMFSGANFMHIFAGHLIDICTMAWAPLILLTIDRLCLRPSSPGWLLVGILAVAMQILAGHPQYLFYTSITVVLYVLISLRGSSRPLAFFLSFVAIYTGAVGIAAVQLLAGIVTAAETVRSTGVTFRFASMFSYPPENLISLITPFFFGDIKTIAYWGRAYMWAMTFYIGLTGFLLALYGTISGDKKTKNFAGIMVLCLIILALGKHTPLFPFLFNYMPGFNMFRGASKFIFPATLFLTMLAAIGMDRLINNHISIRKIVFILVMIGIVFLSGAMLILPWSDNFYIFDLIGKLMKHITATGESYLPSAFFRSPLAHHQAAVFAAQGLFYSTTLVFIMAITIALAGQSRCFRYLIALIAIGEIIIFAAHIKTDFPLAATRIPELADFLKKNPGEYRILNLLQPNSALSMKARDIWGYDPGVLLRYAQFISFTQGYNPGKISNYIDFKENHRLLKMLRLRFILIPEGHQIKILENRDFLPRLNLIENWEVIRARADVLKRMSEESFEPSQTVILEQPIEIAESGPGSTGTKRGVWPISAAGNCRIIDESTDHMTIIAQLPRDAILLITDTYSQGWRITPLHESGQRNYEILPGNYTLMAIPLKKGEHQFRLEYSPWGYRVGLWISFISSMFYIGATVSLLVGVRRAHKPHKNRKQKQPVILPC